MQIFKSFCRLEKKLCHFENFAFCVNRKYWETKVSTFVDFTIKKSHVIRSKLFPSFIEIRPLVAKIWSDHMHEDRNHKLDR